MPHRYWILALLSGSTLINYLDRQALAVVMPTLRREMALSSAEYGYITTAFLMAYSLGQLAAGSLVDRLGVRWGLALFAGVWSLAAVAHGGAQTAGHFLALRILLGLGEAGNWPAGVKSISEWFGKSERAFSLALFDSGSAIGAVLAGPCVAALTLFFGWRAAFICTGTTGLLWLGLWLRFYPKRPPSDLVAEPLAVSLRALLANRDLWGLMATRMLATPVWHFYIFWLPDYLSQGRGLSLREIGLLVWVPYVTVDAGKLVGGRLSDRLIARGGTVNASRFAVMFAAAICMAGGLFVVNAASASTAMAWVSLATFGFGMWSANILALHADLFEPRTMGTAVGWTTAASGLGAAIFTWFTGQMVDAQGYSLVFAVAGSAALLAFAVLWFAVGTTDRIEAPA